jgi:hypothetical protein
MESKGGRSFEKINKDHICYGLSMDCSHSKLVLDFNPHCEVLTGWKLNPSLVFGSKAFGR